MEAGRVRATCCILLRILPPISHGEAVRIGKIQLVSPGKMGVVWFLLEEPRGCGNGRVRCTPVPALWSANPPAFTAERDVETDELAIYAWINPVKPPERVKMERYRMVVMLAVRYGVHHYLDDLWQDWQLGVHQRTRISEVLPVEQREAFSFGIARNLCRSLLRKDPPISVPVLGSSEEPDGRAGIREGEVEKRRLDHPAASLINPSEPGMGPTAWVDSDRLRNCLQRLRPRTLDILRKDLRGRQV